jgi:hypothetical protein
MDEYRVLVFYLKRAFKGINNGGGQNNERTNQ